MGLHERFRRYANRRAADPRGWLLALALLPGCIPPTTPLSGSPWARYVIDDASQGADGVRPADINGDGLPDIATGWEEGGRVRVCLNPGPAMARGRWPAVTVGEVGSPEDAVFVDVDGDGAKDVVSSCEGGGRSIWFHWSPTDRAQILNQIAWQTEALPPARDAKPWMFTLTMQVDGRYGVDLVSGAKGDDAEVGWFESPADARTLSGWRWHPMYRAGWIMSLVAADMDGDGDEDVLVSDRRGDGRGCLWLENPGPGLLQYLAWGVHRIGGSDREVMFLKLVDLDGDGLDDVVCATKGGGILFFRRTGNRFFPWERHEIQLPAGVGTGKAVNVGDVDLDGRLDIVLSCENAGGKSGVIWLSYVGEVTDGVWLAHDISGVVGTKYDLVELLDLDGDGDLDVVTCEEIENLGVIWYENPSL
ncbi:MAG: VCBS repeat-containing protein [Phycisphaerae bacterium]|nr:VCBS repeat-containing protein [Phycisphaerae bacterium]